MFFQTQKEIEYLKEKLKAARDRVDEYKRREEDAKPKSPCAYCGKVTSYIPIYNIKYCHDCEYSISQGRITPN